MQSIAYVIVKYCHIHPDHPARQPSHGRAPYRKTFRLSLVFGKLVDISSDERVDKGTTHGYTVYQVQIGDIVYFGRGEKLPKHPGDTGHGLIVGDPVQAAIEGSDLIIQRPDGKEIKTKVIKRKRAGAM